MPKSYSISETSKRLGVSTATVRYWIVAGAFPSAYRLNPDIPSSHYRIPESDITRFEARREHLTRKGKPKDQWQNETLD